MTRRTVMAILFAAALLTSGVVSYWASSKPDGLEKTAAEQSLLRREAAPATAPLADYKVPGIPNTFLANGAAGVCGALLVLGLLLGFGRLVRKPRAATEAADHNR